jgi:hypothetical protein
VARKDCKIKSIEQTSIRILLLALNGGKQPGFCG